MTTIIIDRALVEQALEALERVDLQSLVPDYGAGHYSVARLDAPQVESAITALHAALAEPVQEPRKFDHGIGADRFKVVRGPAYTWCVLIGDSPTKHGKFYTQASAEEMAALLRREFRNGAFVQHEASAALLEALKEMLEVWEEDPAYGHASAEKARAAIKAVEGEVK